MSWCWERHGDVMNRRLRELERDRSLRYYRRIGVHVEAEPGEKKAPFWVAMLLALLGSLPFWALLAWEWHKGMVK